MTSTTKNEMITGLHVLTDPTSALSMTDQALIAAENGAAIIQLRHKTASDDQMVLWGEEILRAIAPYPCRLILNDRVEAAVKIGAFGVHVGQKDGDIDQIRQKIGSEMCLGLSITHLSQLTALDRHKIDYIGVGPLRATASKKDHDSPLGADGVAEIVASSPCPAIIIGGITLKDLPFLKKIKAAGIAVISAISQDKNPARAVRLFSQNWRDLA